MYIRTINSVGFSAAKAPMLSKSVNRSLLKATKSDLKPLCGPEEVSKAKAIEALNVVENAGIAAGMAQMPGWDELALSANEIKMAMEIYNGVYDFGFDKTTVKSILMGFLGNRIGTWVFKGASKLLTWVPGLGNGLNATVAGGTTAVLGAAIISSAEEMDKARKNGESLANFFKAMETPDKNKQPIYDENLEKKRLEMEKLKKLNEQKVLVEKDYLFQKELLARFESRKFHEDKKKLYQEKLDNDKDNFILKEMIEEQDNEINKLDKEIEKIDKLRENNYSNLVVYLSYDEIKELERASFNESASGLSYKIIETKVSFYQEEIFEKAQAMIFWKEERNYYQEILNETMEKEPGTNFSWLKKRIEESDEIIKALDNEIKKLNKEIEKIDKLRENNYSNLVVYLGFNEEKELGDYLRWIKLQELIEARDNEIKKTEEKEMFYQKELLVRFQLIKFYDEKKQKILKERMETKPDDEVNIFSLKEVVEAFDETIKELNDEIEKIYKLRSDNREKLHNNKSY